MNAWPKIAVSIVVLGACALAAEASAQVGLPQTAALLLRYDADQDGTVSREEMEQGVALDYRAADVNNDNCLDPDEMRAENDRRLARDREVASPLSDWNLDGCVSMSEFGSSVRSYFNFADRSKDDMVSQVELRGPSMPLPYPTVGQQQQRRDPTIPDARGNYSIPGQSLSPTSVISPDADLGY